MKFTVNRNLCVRCGACVRDCVVNALTRDADGFPVMTDAGERYCIGCQHCLAVCPKGAVGICGKQPENSAPNGDLPEPEAMMRLIRQRRSIRKFKRENVEAETLEKLRAALDWTATGCNARLLHFTMVFSVEKMDVVRAKTDSMLRFLCKSGILRIFYPGITRYFDALDAGEDLIYRGAPHMIVASVARKAPCRKEDPVIALSNFDLYAQTLGLGTCWCGFALHAFQCNPFLRRMLELPKGYVPGAVMLFGKPDVHYFRATQPEPFGFSRLE